MQAVCPECNALNPVGNRFCGSCGASLENARVVTGANLAEPRAATTSEEIAYFASDDVLITNARAVFGSKTYVVANITSVDYILTAADRLWGAMVVVVGIAVFLLGTLQLLGVIYLSEGREFLFLAIGVILVGFGVFLMARAKDLYAVQIASASGESEALVSTNGDYVERIVDAVQQAISERARTAFSVTRRSGQEVDMSNQGSATGGHQTKQARMLIVLTDGGEKVRCPCGRGWLWEVEEGPHQGRRGCTTCLRQFLGTMQFDSTWAISYATGERKEIPKPYTYGDWLEENYGPEGAREVWQNEQDAMDLGAQLDAMEDGDFGAHEAW